MTDPFDVATRRQQVVVLAAILAYFVLWAVEVATGNPTAAALSDVVIAVLALGAAAILARRATRGPELDRVAAVATVAFVVTGVGVGYGGVSALTGLPEIVAVEAVGSAALLASVVLYLYIAWA